MSFTCRPATANDTQQLLDVHRAAFSTEVEADLVRELLHTTSAESRQSWVADAAGSVVGHVFLSRGEVAEAPQVRVMLLCPLAVMPSYQHAGVGTALVRAAIAAAGAHELTAVSVFGDPAYYSRFGFRSLLPNGPEPAFDIGKTHRDAWQTLLLSDDPTATSALDGARPQWSRPLMRPVLWQV